MRQNKRHEILRSASSVIADRRVSGLRVEDVADRAGVGTSVICYHFENDRAPSTAFAKFSDDERSDSAYSLLSTALLGDIEDSTAAREFCVVWQELAVSAVFDPELRRHVDEVSTDWTEKMTSIMKVGQQDGSIRADIDANPKSELLTSLLDGLISQWLSGSLGREQIRELLLVCLENRVRPNRSDHRTTANTMTPGR